VLIKYQNKIYNLANLECLYRSEQANYIRVNFRDWCADLTFANTEEAGKAFERILDAYRWQRQVCDLG
jgi:hypothetical protein